MPDDRTRLEYGRVLWKVERVRERLLKHWTDPRHPYRERFIEKYRPLVERLLESAPEDNEKMDEEFHAEGESLRTVMREIPPVFGSFY